MHLGLIIGQIHKVGGMEKQAVLLAQELKNRGIKVTLLISGLRRHRKSGALDLGSLDHRYLYHSRYTSAVGRHLLRYHCKKLEITQLIAYNSGHARFCMDVDTGCEVALNVRAIRFASDQRLAEEHRNAASGCRWVITNSSNTAELLLQNGITDESKLTIIHNGIPLPDHKLSFDNKTILYVGSIKEVKDPMTFVKASHHVIRRDRDIRVIMAGNGDMRQQIQDYISSNGLEKNFVLMGEVPFNEIPYKEAAVFVNSSLRESSSNSLLEALSFGIPVAATDNPGNRDILSRMEHHKLTTVSDSMELGEAIGDLLRLNVSQKSRIFEESRTFIQDNYSVSRMTDQYIHLAEGSRLP